VTSHLFVDNVQQKSKCFPSCPCVYVAYICLESWTYSSFPDFFPIYKIKMSP
jgi:hypothetical protein